MKGITPKHCRWSVWAIINKRYFEWFMCLDQRGKCWYLLGTSSCCCCSVCTNFAISVSMTVLLCVPFLFLFFVCVHRQQLQTFSCPLSFSPFFSSSLLLSVCKDNNSKRCPARESRNVQRIEVRVVRCLNFPLVWISELFI